jgi:uracil-DNA glycosylase
MTSRVNLLAAQAGLLGLAVMFLLVPASALFLDRYGAADLPFVYLAVAVLGLVLVVLGLATAPHGGNRTGRAFTGNRSADTLVTALHRVGMADRPVSRHVGDGLRLHGAWMSSAVRCPPPDHRPTPLERDTCLPWLTEELDALGEVRVLVCLGRFAWDAAARWAGLSPRPRFGHGAEHVTTTGPVLLGCYHPSPQNISTGRLTPDMLDTLLRRARHLATSGAPLVAEEPA